MKTVLEAETEQHRFDEDVTYWGDWSDEALLWGEYYAIEWLKVRPRHRKHRGQLVPDEIIDETEEFIAILKEHNIYFEEQDGTFIIYGYQC